MTEDQCAQLLLRRLKMSEAQLPKPVIVANIATACDRFSILIAQSADRELLRSSFSVSVVSGVGSLVTAFTSARPLQQQFFKGWGVYGTDTTFPYEMLADKESLLLDHPISIGYCAVNNTNLLVVDSLGSRTPTDTLTIRGNVTCDIGTVPIQSEPQFIDVLAEVIMPQAVAQ